MFVWACHQITKKNICFKLRLSKLHGNKRGTNFYFSYIHRYTARGYTEKADPPDNTLTTSVWFLCIA